MKALIVDPRLAGISGDMLLASLVDLTHRINDLYDLAEVLERKVPYCKRATVKIHDVGRLGIKSKRVELLVDEHPQGVMPTAFKSIFEEVLNSLNASDKAKAIARQAIQRLIEAELNVHASEVELHEISSVDTIFDVVGVSLLLDRGNLLNAEVYTTPPALGGGVVKTKHGLLPVPAPATLEILRRSGYRCSAIPISRELTTPTGAALLVSIATSIIEFYPPMRIVGVGYGAGSEDLPEAPNVLRVIEGELSGGNAENVVILETVVDDVTGEVIGHALNKIFEAGALDVAVLPGIGKKNRPINIIQAMAKPENYYRVSEALVNELGTLGVRVHYVHRITVERSQREVEVEVEGRRYKVRVKESRDPQGRILNFKPEYEDLKSIAEELGIPLRRLAQAITSKVEKTYNA
ncbi:MAG: nickel pincer cofactor biosynthesis protein LarC [Candidatus Nezhaarchaeota archaeon]|nr:nickel pincer cofactor biosynthesis protein LarC [Candidatus Nezhaarchaeota archaeon]